MNPNKYLFKDYSAEKKAKVIEENIDKAIRHFIDSEGGYSRTLMCRAVERTFHNYDLDDWWDHATPADFGRALTYLLEFCEKEDLNDDIFNMNVLSLNFDQDTLYMFKPITSFYEEFYEALGPKARLDDIEREAVRFIDMRGAIHYFHQWARPDLLEEFEKDEDQSREQTNQSCELVELLGKESGESQTPEIQSDQLQFKCSNELKEHPEFVDYLFDELSTRGSGFFPDIHWIDSNKCSADDLKFVLGFTSKPKEFKRIAWTYRENRGVSKQRLFELMEALGYTDYVIMPEQNMLPSKNKSQVYMTYNNCITFEGIKAVSRQDFKRGADHRPDLETKNLIKSAIEKYERNTKCSMDELRVHLGLEQEKK